MHDNKIIFHPIGVIHSPHKVMSKTPIQPVFCSDIKGTVVLDAEYADGLKDLQGFSQLSNNDLFPE